jgi:hypothetical protein
LGNINYQHALGGLGCLERCELPMSGDHRNMIRIRRRTGWLSARGKAECTAHGIQAYQTENERNTMLAF